MLNTPFPSWPCFSEEEAEALRILLLTNKVNYWTGDNIRQFEAEFANYVGCEYAVGVTNGTVALELALVACKLEAGDEVVVTPRSFIASASSVVLRGAVPVFADVDENSQAITADTIRDVVTEKTKVIVVVHLGGTPADMDPIMALAEELDLIVIEDCAQAHGAKYKGKSVGSIGHIGAWSFCHDKIMTTGGEGGMVTTNDPHFWSSMWSYKDHGKSWRMVHQPAHGGNYRWLHGEFGTNWRMLEMQAVLGRYQLKQLDGWVDDRIKNSTRIRETANELPALRVPELQENTRNAFYKCYVFVNNDALKSGVSRDTIVSMINERGVPCYVGACPEIYLEEAFTSSGYAPPNRFNVAKKLGETSIMFLVHPTLELEHIDKTCDVLKEVVTECSI